MDELTAIPGLGEKRAGRIVVSRPHESIGAIDAGETDLARFVRTS
jgi:DNA uptake protein ComE-like DNA-binding protein